MAWQGDQGYNSAAESAHAAKMSGVIQRLRMQLQSLAMLLLPAGALVILSLPQFADVADSVTAQIAQLALHLASRQAEVPCDAVLVCGDFNVCPQTRDAGGYDDGQQYLHLTAKLGRLDLQDLWAPAESEPTEGRATLDHIFLNAAAWEVGSKRVARV